MQPFKPLESFNAIQVSSSHLQKLKEVLESDIPSLTTHIQADAAKNIPLDPEVIEHFLALASLFEAIGHEIGMPTSSILYFAASRLQDAVNQDATHYSAYTNAIETVRNLLEELIKEQKK